MLQLPANPDDLSPTAVRSPPIFIAARHGDPGAADLLIRAGADPNAPCTCFSVLRNASLDNTPLHTALQHPDGAIVQILCRARADLNAVDGKGAPSGIDTSISCVCWRVHVRTLTTLPPMTIAATRPCRERRGRVTRKGCESCSTWAQMLVSLTGRVLTPGSVGLGWRRPNDAVAPGSAGGRRWRWRSPCRGRAASARSSLEAGANRAVVPSADHDAQENIYFVGHQNTPEQRAAVDDLVSAHNADAHWLMWFNQGKRSLSRTTWSSRRRLITAGGGPSLTAPTACCAGIVAAPRASRRWSS